MFIESVCKDIRRFWRRFNREEAGTALLELTVITPVIIVIGFGVIEFANLMYKRHLIEGGIRDAARYMAGLDECTDGQAGTDAHKAAAANLATRGTIDTSGALRVSGWTLLPGDITCRKVANSFKNDPNDATEPAFKLRGDQTELTIVSIEDTVTYAAIDLGFLGVLHGVGQMLGNAVNLSGMTFPVKHEERFYGTR